MDIKKELCNVIEFLHWQVEHDKCTEEELESMKHVIEKELKVDATISDIAQHFQQSESNVRNVINRRMVDKPKRSVLYNFVSFLRIVPKNW